MDRGGRDVGPWRRLAQQATELLVVALIVLITVALVFAGLLLFGNSGL